MNESTVQTRCADTRWEVLESRRDQLIGDTAPDWFALERDSRASRFKSGNRRTIWKVAFQGKTIFAKVAEPARSSYRNRIKEWWVGTQVEREWRACRKAASLGVPVVPALAVGVRGGKRPRTVFLSEAVPDARSLLDAWEEDVAAASPRLRRRVAAELIDCVASFLSDGHELGFAHQDAHPSNVLLTPDHGGTPRPVFVDVHSARFFDGPTPYSETMRALAQFDQYFQRRSTRSERLRFLRRYWTRRPSLVMTGSDERMRLEDLKAAKIAHAASLALQRDRRLDRDGKYFSTLSLGNGWRATMVCVLERRHLFPETSIPDRSEDEWRAILGPLTEQAPGVPSPAGDTDFIVERESICGGLRRLGATLGRSRHRRVFEACHRNRHRDVFAPLVLGCVEHRSAGLVDASLLIRAKDADKAFER